MSSSTTIGQVAASNPYVGAALSQATITSGVLSALSQGVNDGPNASLYKALTAHLMGPTLSSIGGSTGASSATPATPTPSAPASTPGTIALQAANNQAAQASALLGSSMGLGGNVNTVA